MRPQVVCAIIVALALGGCLGPQSNPVVTGSLRSTAGAGGIVSRSDEPVRALANAVTTCLDRGTPAQSPAFRRCVTEAQRKAVPRTEATERVTALR